MFQKIPDWLIGVVGVAVLLLFTLAFVAAAGHSLKPDPTPEDMQPIAIYLLSTVNGMLAANLGALVGVATAAVLWGRMGLLTAAGQKSTPFGWFQVGAALWYTLIVLAAWFVWWKKDFTEVPQDIVTAIPEMCRTGLGILLGVFALALGVKR